MPRVQILTTLALTVAFAACGGGGDDAAPSQAAMQSAPQATMAQADLSRCFLRGATVEETAERPSPLRAVAFQVGGTTGQVCYGAPSANGREIMGGLVPYGEYWRSGANEATAIHLDGPAVVGGVALQAGAYSLYTLPTEGSWEVFLNRNFERWGIPVTDEVRTADVGSFTVTPEATSGMVETLTYSFVPSGNGGDLVLEWETTRIRIPVVAGM